VLVVSVDYGDSDRAIVTVVSHTTEVRQSQFEVAIKVPFLRPGAFLIQGVSTYRRHGRSEAWRAQTDQMELISAGLANWLGIRR